MERDHADMAVHALDAEAFRRAPAPSPAGGSIEARLAEIAGHLNRLVQLQSQILVMLRATSGQRNFTRDERAWLATCRQALQAHARH